MKINFFRILAFAPFIALFVQLAIGAQKGQTRKLERVKNPNPGEEVRQSYEQRQADGLKVTIHQLGPSGPRAVHPGESFTNGDRIKVKFESNFDGYIYVINVTPGGETKLLFPWPTSRRNHVRAGQVYDIPASGEFRFNQEAGLEVLQIVMSKSQVYFLEAALDRAPSKARNIPIGKDAGKLLEKLTGKPKRLKGSGIAPQTESKQSAGLQTRILKLEPRKEGSILVLSGAKGSNRFGPGEISLFEVRLNHY